MSTIDLIILGSLYQSPKSAYELQKQIEDRHLARWVKIGSYTVYKKVIQYEKKGFVLSETKKNGNMPEKTVYTLTSNGKTKFRELMSEFSAGETRIFLDFNAVIVNMSLLDDTDFKECMNNIKNSICKTKTPNTRTNVKTKGNDFIRTNDIGTTIYAFRNIRKMGKDF